ncbi:imidazolonepropionase [Pseudoxanthobacter soli DSM 19599]|uniref:Imidazolonepropionase n=1 Tax=Pseudoxanthobacter soli DSM 19599 TaxID=1123029 RepID=A0A1M7ZKX1_9HYPH|nr:imidazolonepropionase [Pseudoxanthobacter soli]SHO65550.1 imidazolonepropionase [Pseudoxanthobacter soli DSM 19599]
MTRFVDTLWTGARLATLDPQRPGLGIVEDGAIAARDGRIVFAGPHGDLPGDIDAAVCEDLDGRWVTPGLIDCHTHLVHGGDRAMEFEMRLAGESYEAIAAAGGGILSTVNATRRASEADLVASALPRLDALLAEGVTTVEVKSGYGLDEAAERRMLGAARDLAGARRVRVATTYLGAHAVPPEFKQDRAGYLDLVCERMIPALAAEGLADAVDGFCEGIAFQPDEIARVFTAAQAAGLPVKLHADQLSDLSGAALAARFGALSADHLEYTSEAGAEAMAAAGTVAVILPGAFYVLRERQAPPIEAFRRHGVPMAVATDCNPGTAPITSLLTTMNMAATLFRMTVGECLAGVTREAARALGRADEVGTIEAGKACDLAIWNIERPAELVYRIGFNPLHRRIFAGS